MTSAQRSIITKIGNNILTPGIDGRYILLNSEGKERKFEKTQTPAIQSLIVHGKLVVDPIVTDRVCFKVKTSK